MSRSDDDSLPNTVNPANNCERKPRSVAARDKRLHSARLKRQLDNQILQVEPESEAAKAIRRKRLVRARRRGMKRAAANRDLLSTRAVGRQRRAPSSPDSGDSCGRMYRYPSWKFQDRVRALLERPDELFRVLPTVYGASHSTPFTFEALNRLRPKRWFTDETINYFFAAIGEETTLDPSQIAIVSSYFYATLTAYGPASDAVRRYGRPASEKNSMSPGLLGGDVLLIPINWRGSHWGMISVHTRERAIQVWDSLHSSGMGVCTEFCRLITEWVENEHTWRGQIFQSQDWKLEVVNTPQQTNSYDCGVYVCSFAAALVRGHDLEVVDEKSALRFRAEMLCSALSAAVRET